MSLVAEQLISSEEITGWKVALKEIHAALNKQVRLTFVAIVYYSATLLACNFGYVSQRKTLLIRLSSKIGSIDEHSY